MSGEIDPNEIAIGVATHILDGAFKGLAESASSQFKKIETRLKRGFPAYISASLSRTKSVKTLIHPDESIDIESIYVPLTYVTGSKQKRDKDIIEDILSGGKILVSGTAGGGKSMLIKYINTIMLSGKHNILPIYFELRSLNAMGGKSLLSAVHESVNNHIKSLYWELFNEYVSSGRVAFILDGFDEINHDLRARYGEEIQKISLDNQKLSILVTSRPEDDLPGLEQFRVYKCLRMSRQQCVNLLSKIEFDTEKKRSFIDQVKSNLYQKHIEFLSNPLMTTMMLLTYSYHSDIPDKIHIFYQQAFETLFQRHDRSKGVYTRKSYTHLPMDEFQRILEHFCASSYIMSDFSFDGDKIRKYIKSSIVYCGAEVLVDDFLSDLRESVCLIQADGVELSFVHRSFQEYFSARFISSLPGEKIGEAVDAICTRSQTDSVVKIIYSINKYSLETHWALPRLNELIEMTKNKDGSYSPIKLFPIVFSKFIFHKSGASLTNANGYWGDVAMTIWIVFDIMGNGGRIEVNEIRSGISKLKNNVALFDEFFNFSMSLMLLKF